MIRGHRQQDGREPGVADRIAEARAFREEVTDILAEALLALVLSGRPASPLVSAKKKRATGRGSNVASA